METPWWFTALVSSPLVWAAGAYRKEICAFLIGLFRERQAERVAAAAHKRETDVIRRERRDKEEAERQAREDEARRELHDNLKAQAAEAKTEVTAARTHMAAAHDALVRSETEKADWRARALAAEKESAVLREEIDRLRERDAT